MSPFLALLVLGQKSFPISPSDPRIVYVGRFDQTDRHAASCQWPASEVRLVVNGSTLIAKMEEFGADRWEVVLDGSPKYVIAPTPGTGAYRIDLGAPQTHSVSLVKRTEAFVGSTTFRAFECPGGRLLQAHRSRHTIEFVGDSITCGFGNEGSNAQEPFKPETENAYFSFASIAARQLNADASLIAWSGRKMWPDGTMPEIYDRVMPTRQYPQWNFSLVVPEVVVIHLATNDFGKENPEEAGWTAAYESFIRLIWSHYPNAHVYAALGCMMSDTYPKGHRALSTARGYLTRMIARIHDSRLHFVEFDVQDQANGIGASWHPSVKTDQIMADRLTATIRRDLGW